MATVWDGCRPTAGEGTVSPKAPEGGHTVDFSPTADDYDRYRPPFPRSFYARLEAEGWIAPRLRALDIGTGTGTLALALATRGLQVVALDPSAAMLDAARGRASTHSLDVRFVEARAEDTGLDPGAFDLVTAGHCWWWLDAPHAIAEARRVLKPGGRLLLANFSYLPTPGSVAEASERLILQHNPGWPKAGESGIRAEQVADLDAAGFDDVVSFSWVEPVAFTHEAWRGRMRSCNGVGASLAPEGVAAFDRALAELLAGSFPHALVVPHRLFVATGRAPSPGVDSTIR